jgi:DNA-directed RNA polymerase specialized sigma subunit
MDSNCTECPSYNRGAGEPACLKCNTYKYVFQSETGGTYHSNSVKTGPCPPTVIIENLPNPEQTKSIFNMIAALETREASILMLFYFAKRTVREIAKTHRLSSTRTHDIIKESISKINEIFYVT